jgi:acetamidase/formamidase
VNLARETYVPSRPDEVRWGYVPSVTSEPVRATYRLTVIKKGGRGAPSVAFGYPFAETPDAWVPIGLSDPDGSLGGQGNDLDIAMRRAVVNALDFLQHDLGLDRAVAYAYLSAAADFSVSQVVDRTVGVHGVIPKDRF